MASITKNSEMVNSDNFLFPHLRKKNEYDSVHQGTSWLKAFSLAVLLMVFVGITTVIPSSITIFFVFMVSISLFCLIKPKAFVYISLGYLCFRYMFTPSINRGNYGLFLDFLHFGYQDAPLIKYADEWVGIMAAILVLKLIGIDKRKSYVTSKTKIISVISLFGLFSLISALVNLVGPITTIYFLEVFLRPVLVFLVIVLIDWDEKSLNDLFCFTFMLSFPFQIGVSAIQNMHEIVRGNIFWIDNFIGTFVYPMCQVACCLIAFGITLLGGQWLVFRQKKVLIYIMIGVLSIIAAQAGFFTVLWIIALGLWTCWILVRPNLFAIGDISNKTPLLLLVVCITGVGIYIAVNPPEFAKGPIVSYTRHKLLYYYKQPWKEQPKLKTYVVLGDNITKGIINPVVGVGPGRYLSGAAFKYETELTRRFTAGALLASGTAIGAGEHMRNSTVGLIGEIGFFGWFFYITIYIRILLFLLRDISKIKNMKWHGRCLGTIGVVFFLMFYSMGYGAFGAPVESLMAMVLCGICCKMIELRQSEI